MSKSRVARRVAILISFMMLITSAVNTTYGYIVTLTESLVTVFEPDIQESQKPDEKSVSVEIEINKTVKNTGSVDRAPEGFEFVLRNTDTDSEVTVSSNIEGTARFVLKYYEEDVGKTYTYTLKELDKGGKGLTYDTREYTVSVTVEQKSNGKLATVKKLDGVQVEDIVAHFENIYHNEGESSPDTYDGSDVNFWFVMMIVSGCVFGALMIYEKKYARR